MASFRDFEACGPGCMHGGIARGTKATWVWARQRALAMRTLKQPLIPPPREEQICSFWRSHKEELVGSPRLVVSSGCKKAKLGELEGDAMVGVTRT
jgi:hypothetical protein